jgi:putative tryptophan/tyrosine transport system substrate-binding protein
VILTRNAPVTAAVRRETSTIPIVFVLVADHPVGDGFVQSLARPGGNITGFSTVEPSLGGKWLELLREIAPQVGQVGVMFDPDTAPNGGSFYFHLIETAAVSIAVRVSTAPVSDDKDIFRTIEASAKERNFGVIVMPDQTTTVRRKAIIEAAARYRVPTIYPYLFAADEGGLISYEFEVADIYRQAAGYIDRILRGSKPDELPVQEPVRFQLIINLNAAKSLGLVVPPIMQQRADKVIE